MKVRRFEIVDQSKIRKKRQDGNEKFIKNAFKMRSSGDFCQASIFKSFRTSQHDHHIPDDIFKCIFFNENLSISSKMSLSFIHC